MTKYLTNNIKSVNLYKKPSYRSYIVTQMIFGESFVILKKKNTWFNIKIKEDDKETLLNSLFSFQWTLKKLFIKK